MNALQDQINRISRGTTSIVSAAELKKKLGEGRPLRVKLGVDPTAPDIHLGHTVVLNKLRVFQDLGHQVVFILGDFTAAIGDPSGRDTTRPPLSQNDIQQNIRTYEEQVFKVLDQSKTEIRRNSEWLDPLFDKRDPNFVLNKMLREHTVQQLLERDDFTERKKAGQPITLLELLYPLFQGYDSVAVKADVELGGNDQLFNLLMGRKMQKDAGMEPQVVITLPLLEGLDGGRKMSKSYGNHVGVKDAHNEMFSKIMSISDELMWSYYTLLTEEDLEAAKSIHPKEAKERLAELVTARFHGRELARAAREEFNEIFSKRGTPDVMAEFVVKEPMDAVKLLVASGSAPSNNEARRLLAQSAVEIGGKKINVGEKIAVKEPMVMKVGKKTFRKLIPAR